MIPVKVFILSETGADQEILSLYYCPRDEAMTVVKIICCNSTQKNK